MYTNVRSVLRQRYTSVRAMSKRKGSDSQLDLAIVHNTN